GVSRATFYVYFASKEQVFAVLADQVRERFLRAQDLAGLDPNDVDGVLRLTIETTLEATVECHGLMAVLNHQAVADPAIGELWQEIQRKAVHRTANYVRQQAEAGRVGPAGDPEAARLVGGGGNHREGPLLGDAPGQG